MEIAPPSAELDMVGERYRLLQRLVAPTEAAPGVWRGQDTVLNRQVMVTLHEPGGPAAKALLKQAHALSMIEHPALPRVFDAEDEGTRTWVVSEWVDGTPLTGVLTDGPFDANAAAAAVAGLAEGVAQVHQAGLPVGLLDPEHVVMTSRGTVTVTRLLVGAGSPADDVRHLGALLYVLLTGVWPLPDGGGGQRGVTEHGTPPAPRQVRAGVPAELSAVTMQALCPTDPQRLTTAQAVAEALSRWHRQAEPEPFVADLPAAERYADKPRRPRRLGPLVAVIGGFCAIGVAGLLIGAVANQQGGAARPSVPAVQSNGTSATSGAVRPVQVAAVTLYDPPPGDGQEHPNEVDKAADGDPDTAWSTLEYRRSPYFGNLKPGVGLIFDLGRPTSVGQLRIQTKLPGTDAEVRVGPSSTGQLDSFRPVYQGSLSQQTNTITLRPDISSQYYLVWFTKLVSDGDGRYVGDLAEVQFLG